MKRRGFIGSIIASAAAPAIVRADLLMRVHVSQSDEMLIRLIGGAADGREIRVWRNCGGLVIPVVTNELKPRTLEDLFNLEPPKFGQFMYRPSMPGSRLWVCK